jgi:hypothetical protein
MEIRFLIAEGPSNILLLQNFEAQGTRLKVWLVVLSMERFVTEYPFKTIGIACATLRLQFRRAK